MPRPVKKLTVIGIIGKTQGVMSAARPAKNATNKNPNNDFPCGSSLTKVGSRTGPVDGCWLLVAGCWTLTMLENYPD